MGAGRQTQLLHGSLQQAAGGVVDLAKLPRLPTGHATVGQRAAAGKALRLHLPGTLHLVAHLAAAGAGGGRTQFFVRYGGYFDVNIDAIE